MGLHGTHGESSRQAGQPDSAREHGVSTADRHVTTCSMGLAVRENPGIAWGGALCTRIGTGDESLLNSDWGAKPDGGQHGAPEAISHGNMRLNSPRRGSDDGDTTEEHSAGRTHGTATTGRCLDKTRVRSLHSSACRQCTRAAQDTKPRQVRHHVCRNPRGTSVQTGWRTQCSPQRHATGPTGHGRADTDTETENTEHN